MSSWEEFRQRLLATSPNSYRKKKSEAALQNQNQCPNESVTPYAEHMARLFRREDPSLTDYMKVRHLMHGVKRGIFAGYCGVPRNGCRTRP
ncbi:hypothetical protein HPB48_022448 [Haemaphysalis longicornis]|uniref:Retrotransposon gag domain-containing protein n=1 Tax=Haemaphysalis longicornis TaxID=44386 RepID=A0A9J6GJB0_HAELO|nr:hypothetical protein HPB48_022448 [Haemaphysalis longicornis]